MSDVDPELTAWVLAHAASFEVAPLVEVVKGRQLQVGFTVSLYGRLPMDKPPGAERRAAAAEIRERLVKMIQSLAPTEGSRATLEIQAPRPGVVLEPEGEREPEVAVVARVFHGDDYFAETTVGEEKKVYAGTRRLVEMGLKERRRIP